MKKNVIVTGGAGFLGSHLVPGLLEAGYSVHVIDNLVAGKREHIPEEAIFSEADITDAAKLDEAFAQAGEIQGVFHLAALPRVQHSIESPEETNKVNVDGLLNVFMAAKKHGAKRIVYSASSAAYGDQETLPLSESLAPEPKSPYAVQKYAGEHYARVMHSVYGVEAVSLRYFNLYGKNADPNGPYAGVVIKFIDQRSKGQAMTVTGDGSQTRDYVHVKDVVRANILALESDRAGKGEVINIGSGKDVPVLEIARMIGGPVTHIPPRIEPRYSRADISKAKLLLGWEPQISLEEGISELKRLYGLE